MKFFLTIAALSTLPVFGQDRYILVGTYDSPKSEGIYVYRFNSETGAARQVSHVKTSNPSFIAVSPDERFVYAVHETAPQDGKGGDVAAFSFDKKTGKLSFINRELSGGDHPCHVEVDKTGKWLFASNYTSGSVSVLPIRNDGSLGIATTYKHQGAGKHPQRQKSPHAHGAIISEDNKFLFVTDLGIDKVMIYAFNAETGKLAEQGFATSLPGSGPRLLTFHPNHQWAYVVEELSGTVSSYNWKGNQLYPAQRIRTMKDGDTSFAGSGDIHISPDGKFLYASNRGDVNNLAIYTINKHGGLSLVGHQSTLGKTPRNFSIDPSGKFLLCENQNSDEVIIFRRNKKSGLLTDSGQRMTLGKPVCIKWINVN